MKKQVPRHKRIRFYFQVVVIALSVVVLVPQLRDFASSEQKLSNFSIGWMSLGFVVFCLSFVFAAAVYQAVSVKRLSFKNNVLVQLATAFTNRLLPSGIGGMGTNVVFLTNSGYDRASALSLAVANNLIGFIAFLIILLSVGALSVNELMNNDRSSAVIAALVIISLIGLAFFMSWHKARVVAVRQISLFVASFLGIARHPLRLIAALSSSLLIAVCYIAALYLCMKGAGVVLPLRSTIIVFAAGIAAITVSPTPGGLGAAEVAMLASFEQFGIASVPAITAVMSYRIISFWLPIIPGYLAFRYISSKNYV